MMRTIFAALVVFGGLALSGCSSVPTATPDQMKQDVVNFELPAKPTPGMAIVYVVRPDNMGGLVRFNVFVDDKEAASEVGYTRGGQYIYFDVTPGTHKILSKAENWADADISVKAGDIIYIHQEPHMGIIMARNTIYLVKDYEGKYDVKRLKLGTIEKKQK